MANIVRLKVTGFKSFVDPVEVAISPGLTGVVGPNGCGKSNVVEALRWAMGETSAKQLRGDGMDDVIFSGGGGRPSRNHAEVTIGLTDPDGAFPAPWIGQAELEISRRIERGSGSSYRVNGRDTRARDVQTLFADLASGARSAAIVSQGQIGAFVLAKPEQRRSILEEAAGVAGLRARRHEATLRLNAAETNLERLEDILTGFDNQLASLQKQARQANRFRKLSDLIRAADAAAFLARWRLSETERTQAFENAKIAESAVAEAASEAARAERLASEATAALPAARRLESEAAATQQRLRLELERIDAERRRRADARAAAQQRLDDVGRDREREEERKTSAERALIRLSEETTTLLAIAADLDAPEKLDSRIKEATAIVAEKTEAANRAADQAAEIEANNRALSQRFRDAESRLERANSSLTAAERAYSEAEKKAPPANALEDATAQADKAREALAEISEAAESFKEAVETLRANLASAQEARAAAASAEAALTAETKTLSGLLENQSTPDRAPVLDHIRAKEGHETALGAALGDDLEASLDPTAGSFWGEAATRSKADLPSGAQPLSDFVSAPDQLLPRLSQIGFVESSAAAEALAPSLAQGQRLVSAEGGLWRWDGFVRRPGAETATARRLALKNRLETAEVNRKKASEATAAALAVSDLARADLTKAEADEREAQNSVQAARKKLDEHQNAAAHAERDKALYTANIAAKAEAVANARQQVELASAELNEASRLANEIAEPDTARSSAENTRAEANAAQLSLSEAKAERQRLEAAKAENARRLKAVTDEELERKNAISAAESALLALASRATEAESAIAAAEEGDNNEDSDRARILDALETAESKRRALGDALAKAETEASRLAAAAKTADTAASSAREARAVAAAKADQARVFSQNLLDRIAEKLDATPGDLAKIAGVDPENPPSDLDALDRKVERLRRERENMGGVNLRAETEIEEIEEQSETIRREREDLIQAISKLRRGVSDLSGEARQRLRQTFDLIDKEFSQLFQRLFGGGRARLALVGSDDPLEAGLEIMASPPGKSLQTLSLLSGGERALTALALVFAAFRCNPSPICVLDEVDAPLDDSNVDRVCSLLEEMASEGHTRFLVVTHHRMTMARMDRLYGVTMPERGISQLVSVNFDDAAAMREAG